MIRYLLDTNVVSSLIRERGASSAFQRASTHRDCVCTSVIVAAEVRFGYVKKGSDALRREAERVLAGLVVLPIEHPADVHYAIVRTNLERRGVPIGGNDLLIAAQCLALGATLVTNNRREFDRVEGLLVENWLEP